MKKAFLRLKLNAIYTVRKCKDMLRLNAGESTVGTAITILTSVVLGGLLLAGLYLLLKNEVLPSLSTKIQDMFNYKGQ